MSHQEIAYSRMSENLGHDAQLERTFSDASRQIPVLLRDPDVLPTNNESERTLRTSIVHCKMTNCFRSEWGEILRRLAVGHRDDAAQWVKTFLTHWSN